MRINVALFGKDTNYSSRLQNGLQRGYSKKMVVNVYSDERLFLSELKAHHFDAVILGQDCIDLKNDISDTIPIAVLVDDSSIELYEDTFAIGKYQNIETLYRRIVGLCAENTANIKLKSTDEKSRIVLFTSVQGGAGTSSLAVAYAIYSARIGKKVFYLSLDAFGSTSHYFEGSGVGSFSDVIYALKKSNTNLNMKLTSIIKKDKSGVEFIDECPNAYDMLEIKDSEVKELIKVICSLGEYDEIVIDYSDLLSKRHIMLLKDYSDSIIYVNDGSYLGNTKFQKFCESIKIIENRDNCSIIEKIGLVYNRYSSKNSQQLDVVPTSVLGGINRIEGFTDLELIEEIISKDVLSNIL